MSLDMNHLPDQWSSSNIPPPPPVEQQKKPPTLPPLPPLYKGESPATEPISSSHTVDRTIKSRFQAAVAAFKDIFGVGVLRWSPSQMAKIRANMIQHASKIKGSELSTAELRTIDAAIDQLRRINSVRKSTLETK